MYENLTNIFKTNLQKLLADNKLYIRKKDLSSSIGYKTANSITKDFDGSKEPFWQKTCKCIEYLYSNVPCFNLNDLIPTMEEKQEDKKSFAELEKDYKTLKTNHEQLEKQFNQLNQFANFINIIKTLSPERQDTLINLMSAECFAEFLTKLREYSHRALVFDTNNKISHGSTANFFKPYEFKYFVHADVLCQQTIYVLRSNYITKKQEDTEEAWTANRQKFKQDKIEYVKQHCKIRGWNTRIKNINIKYSNIACQYDDKYLNKFKFNDLDRRKQNLDTLKYEWDYSVPDFELNSKPKENKLDIFDEQKNEQPISNLPLRKRPDPFPQYTPRPPKVEAPLNLGIPIRKRPPAFPNTDKDDKPKEVPEEEKRDDIF